MKNKSHPIFSTLGTILLVIAIISSVFIVESAYAAGPPQIQTGSLSGVIQCLVGTQVRPAPYATVVVTLSPTAKITAQTNSQGYYIFAALPIGTGYSVTASKSGYTPSTRYNIQINSGKNTSCCMILLPAK